MTSDDGNSVLTTLLDSENDSTTNPQTDLKFRQVKTEKKTKKEKKKQVEKEERIILLTADNNKTLTVDLNMTIEELESRMSDAVKSVKSESTEVFYDFEKINTEHETNQRLIESNKISENLKNLLSEQKEVYSKIKKIQ